MKVVPNDRSVISLMCWTGVNRRANLWCGSLQLWDRSTAGRILHTSAYHIYILGFRQWISNMYIYINTTHPSTAENNIIWLIIHSLMFLDMVQGIKCGKCITRQRHYSIPYKSPINKTNILKKSSSTLSTDEVEMTKTEVHWEFKGYQRVQSKIKQNHTCHFFKTVNSVHPSLLLFFWQELTCHFRHKVLSRTSSISKCFLITDTYRVTDSDSRWKSGYKNGDLQWHLVRTEGIYFFYIYFEMNSREWETHTSMNKYICFPCMVTSVFDCHMFHHLMPFPFFLYSIASVYQRNASSRSRR